MSHIFNRISKKGIVLILLLAALLLSAAGTTVAFIIARSSPAENTFTPANVSCAVNEVFQNNVKRDVTVINTGSTHAFVRSTLVINWVSESDGKIHAISPVAGVDYEIIWGSAKWTQGSDGFWYYPEKLAVGESTENLIDTCALINDAPEGYRLSVQILASAIQAEPARAVEEAWGVRINGDTIMPN